MQPPQPDVSLMNFHLATDAEWLAVAKERDEHSVATARVLAETLHVTVKEDTIGGVNVFWVTPPEIGASNARRPFSDRVL